MNKRLDEILVSFGSIGVLIALKHLLKPNLVIACVMAALGAILLLWGERILNGEPNRIKSFFINIVGVLFIVGGIQSLAELYSAEYWWMMGLVGVGLYSTHHWISERL
jgi:hypothetical protein